MQAQAQAHQDQELVGSNDHQSLIMKRKRTKRQRSSSPFGLAVTSSSSSACGGNSGGGGGGGCVVVEEYNSSSISSSPATTTTTTSSTEEEEDMANCLIMLAQSDGPKRCSINTTSTRKFSEIATTTNKAGFYVYECKTCNRSFPSFQALGGHRASHKKPKLAEDNNHNNNKSPPIHGLSTVQQQQLQNDTVLEQEQEEKRKTTSLINITSTERESPVLALQVSSNKLASTSYHHGNKLGGKVHECSICGSEFTSGQALGGHMRRHRAAAAAAAAAAATNNQAAVVSSADTATTSTSISSNGGSSDHDMIKTRNILSLDLNLPAPEDDLTNNSSKFQFGASSSSVPIVFSTPALVDCHY